MPVGVIQCPVNAEPIGDNARLCSLTHHAGLAYLNIVLSIGHAAADASVQIFMLKEHYGIRILYSSHQQAFGVIREGGVNHLEPGRFCEPGLVALRMERPCAGTTTCMHPYNYIN